MEADFVGRLSALLGEIDFRFLDYEHYYIFYTETGWRLFVNKDADVVGSHSVTVNLPNQEYYQMRLPAQAGAEEVLGWVERKGYPVTRIQRQKRLAALLA